MNRFAAAGALAATLAVAPAALSAPAALAPCEKLADYARTLPDSAWAKGGAKALAPVLQIDPLRSGKQLSPFEAALAKQPAVTEAFGDENGVWATFVDRLAGTDLYAASSIQGTLHCQDMVFLEAAPGRPVRQVTAPRTFEDTELCWSASASFGQASGQPVFLVHTWPTADSADEAFEITPRAGAKWRPACRLTLRLRTDLHLESRYCGDRAVCEAAGRIARDVAVAYNQKRKDGSDGRGFAYGPSPSAEALAAAQRAQAALPGGAAEFPTFGAPESYAMSYSGFVLFPLKLGGREYFAAITHEGVGWREGYTTLLAIYEPNGGDLVPLAGFVVPRSVTGLAEAKVEPATTPNDND